MPEMPQLRAMEICHIIIVSKKYVDEIGKIDLAGKELEQGKQKITISLIVTRQ